MHSYRLINTCPIQSQHFQYELIGLLTHYYSTELYFWSYKYLLEYISDVTTAMQIQLFLFDSNKAERKNSAKLCFYIKKNRVASTNCL